MPSEDSHEQRHTGCAARPPKDRAERLPDCHHARLLTSVRGDRGRRLVLERKLIPQQPLEESRGLSEIVAPAADNLWLMEGSS